MGDPHLGDVERDVRLRLGPEVALVGGMANVGKVVRIGDTVRRPIGPHSDAVHALLRHLDDVGFDGAPRYLGIDDKGRSVLDFIAGDVGLPPYPAWTAAPALLASVAGLQRRFHDAARTFVMPDDLAWDRTLAPGTGDLACHNDLCVENVVVRDGRAVAFIDFDFAAPTDPLWDIAIALRHWVPVIDPADLVDGRAGVDQRARLMQYCDAYALDDVSSRARLGALIAAFLDQALVKVRDRAESGQAGYVELWANGYEGRNRRARAWIDANADALII